LPASSTYQDDLALIETAVKEAGKIARAGFHAADTEVWDKEKGHPVTQTDIDVNNYLLRVLMQARPHYGWLSEETKDDKSRHDCARSFVVDPIDGTRAFIDRSPNFAVSVAIIESGQPIVAALYNPLKDELYTAQSGAGAFLNGAPINASTCSQIKDCRMVGYPRKFRRLGWPDMNVSVVNSMAYRMCLVASGEVDGTVAFTPKSDWDLAAAILVVSEAKGHTTTITGAPIRFDEEKTSNLGVICAGPNMQPLLLERVKPLIDAFYKSDNKVRDFSHLGTTPEDRQENKRMQLLHLVIGGELIDPMKTEFKDLTNIDFVGAFPNYDAARDAWKSAAQRTVDNAHMRYFVLHAHELIDPDKDGVIG
jgi:myo-inositol-1(or 4)-monophosphatase